MVVSLAAFLALISAERDPELEAGWLGSRDLLGLHDRRVEELFCAQDRAWDGGGLGRDEGRGGGREVGQDG